MSGRNVYKSKGRAASIVGRGGGDEGGTAVTKNVGDLRNIGPTIRKRLNEIGVHTRADLKRIGAVDAYLRICARFPRRTIAVCYYLYSLQGALMDLHRLPERLKSELVSKASRGARAGKRAHS
jgi:DNA transformation protein